MNRPHSREKRIVDKKVNVAKKDVNKQSNKNVSVLNVFRKTIKK